MRSWTGLFLFGVIALAGAAYEAQAVDVNVGVGVGHRRNGGSFSFSTGDSAYQTWYPAQTQTYVYTQPTYVSPTYSSTTYGTTYYQPAPYVYTTPSVGVNAWFGGNDRYRNYDNNYRNRYHNRR